MTYLLYKFKNAGEKMKDKELEITKEMLNANYNQLNKDDCVKKYDCKNKINDKFFVSHSKITKAIRQMKEKIRLNNDEHDAALVHIKLSNNEPLSVFEEAVLFTIYKFIDDGLYHFSIGQIYKKLHGGGNKKRVPDKSYKLIAATVEKLRTTLVIIESQTAAADKMLGNFNKIKQNLLTCTPIEGKLNGQLTTIYVVQPFQDPKTKQKDYRPLYLQQIKHLKQFELLDDTYFKITKQDKEKKYISLTTDRVTIIYYLLTFITTLIHARGHMSKKKPYNQIYVDCNLKMNDMKKKRTKAFVKDVLNHYKSIGLITDFREYTNQKNEDGIEILLRKKRTSSKRKNK